MNFAKPLLSSFSRFDLGIEIYFILFNGSLYFVGNVDFIFVFFFYLTYVVPFSLASLVTAGSIILLNKSF